MTLKELREAVARNQVEVAAECRVSTTTVSAWERGAVKPRLIHVRELARIYHVTIAEINSAIAETEKQSG